MTAAGSINTVLFTIMKVLGIRLFTCSKNCADNNGDGS